MLSVRKAGDACEGIESYSRQCFSVLPAPGGLSLSVPECEGIVSFHDFRARIRSVSPSLIFEPVIAISSPLVKLIPMSSKKDFGHR